MTPNELRSAISELLADNPRGPVVVYSALWPFFRALDLPKTELPQTLLQIVLDAAGRERSVLMPAFTAGYKGGVCDLDQEPVSTGILSDLFRRSPGCGRNLSAFFSFGIVGPQAEEFGRLRPEYAWGDGSSYDWMENNNASFLMLGVDPTHCSYLHRMEWLAKDALPYRFVKEFSGTVVLQGKKHAVTEKLFVRNLNPEAVNDFTVIGDALRKGGLKSAALNGITVAHMAARDMKAAFLPLILRDPLIVVKNRSDFARVESKNG